MDLQAQNYYQELSDASAQRVFDISMFAIWPDTDHQQAPDADIISILDEHPVLVTARSRELVNRLLRDSVEFHQIRVSRALPLWRETIQDGRPNFVSQSRARMMLTDQFLVVQQDSVSLQRALLEDMNQ